MSFDQESVTTHRIAEDAEYEGVRATFQAALGNTRLPMQIDIGFSDIITPGPTVVIYPVILENPAPELLGYNRETAIAEKFQAMVKLGELNSRMKDFFDVWVLARTESFRGAELASAIEQTFQRRSTPLAIDPPCFAKSFTTNVAKAVQWQAFIRRGRFGEPMATFADVVKSIAVFLGPVNSALITGKAWSLTWQAGGLWTSEA